VPLFGMAVQLTIRDPAALQLRVVAWTDLANLLSAAAKAKHDSTLGAWLAGLRGNGFSSVYKYLAGLRLPEICCNEETLKGFVATWRCLPIFRGELSILGYVPLAWVDKLRAIWMRE
jgi:hypothetical protein